MITTTVEVWVDRPRHTLRVSGGNYGDRQQVANEVRGQHGGEWTVFVDVGKTDGHNDSRQWCLVPFVQFVWDEIPPWA